MLSLGLSLLGIGKNLLSWLTAGFKWIFASCERVAIALLLALALYLYVDRSSALASAAKWKRTAEVEMALRISNETAYKNAQSIAADMNKRQVAAIKDRYDAIAEKSEIDYEKRLADNKLALNNWMRRQALGRSAGEAGASSPAEVRAETAGTEALPVIPRGFALVPESDLEKTADIQATLAALQQAVIQVMAVDTNK